MTTITGEGVYVRPTGIANANEGLYGLYRGRPAGPLDVPEWSRGP